MCGRFSLRLNRNEIRRVPQDYGEVINDWVDEEEFIPRYNIAPRTQAPVLRRRNARFPDAHTDTKINRSLILQTMKWGLVPHWSKFEDKSLSTTNARSENLVEGGGMWASIKGKKRCAVLVQGYYEWLTKGKDKIPHFTKRKDGKVMLLAGLYDSVVLEGRTLWTFTIVTTDANRDFSWLHDRQPVILSDHDALEKWLDTSSQSWTPQLTEMVKPYHDEKVPLECYQVPKEVGKVGTESPTFIEPVTNRKDGIQAMFSRQKEQAKGSSPIKSPPSATKRKRSQSPSVVDITLSSDTKPSSSKKIKSGVDPEDAGDSNQPRASSSKKIVDKKSSAKPQSSPTKGSPTKRKPKKESNAAGSSKITSFFDKA
ncbi:DUF159-domain-containing protein [Crucibulum laeve]|uniref:DUF159-domain-containing protein n=1 Tax=Crucibulum laeve TaxID=68775 RepID=A0A5C3LYM5_9AGAR|nr:DUF159-domain-containing protein [Crucibulum laeve]